MLACGLTDHTKNTFKRSGACESGRATLLYLYVGVKRTNGQPRREKFTAALVPLYRH